MTNSERLISLCGFSPANVNAISGELLDAGIDGAATYTADNMVPVKTAALKLMELLLTTADVRNENGYDIKFDRNAVMARVNQLKNELGLIDTALPFVTSRPAW